MTGSQTAVLLLYSATIFLGAGLLFVVQPMVGKMVLPLLGGTPAVWSTCMVFFQAALLLGYAYAHASTAWLGARRQAVLHVAVLALPLAMLALAGLTIACAAVLWRSGRHVIDTATPVAPGESEEGAPTLTERLRWVALAFVPSSLLLGATTYITMDIAAVPLLWVLPLATYLLTFIVAFGRWPARLHRLVTSIVMPAVLLMIFAMISELLKSISLSILCHLLLLLVVALAGHGELALRR